MRMAIRPIVGEDKRGLALRVAIEDAARGGLGEWVQGVLESCDLGAGQCDLILDLGNPNFEPIDGFVGLLAELMAGLPYLRDWRRFALIGTSFPASIAVLRAGASIVPRDEWRLYKLLAGRLGEAGVRIPFFGDYTVNHPNIIELDMRLVKPYASVRYTINNGWLVVRGQNVRDYGFGQYRELCGVVIRAREYCGRDFSQGDDYIQSCAQGIASTGNLTTWRWVGTNHHLEMVARDIAGLAYS